MAYSTIACNGTRSIQVEDAGSLPCANSVTMQKSVLVSKESSMRMIFSCSKLFKILISWRSACRSFADLPCFRMNFKATIWPVFLFRPLNTCCKALQSLSLLHCWGGQLIFSHKLKREITYLAKGTFSDKLNDVVAFHRPPFRRVELVRTVSITTILKYTPR